MDKEAIYLRLPVFLQNFIVSLEGGKLRRRRYGCAFREKFSEIKARATMPVGLMVEYQARRCRVLLKRAQSSGFWKQRFACYGVDVNSSDILGEIRKLPVLTKDEVMAHCYELQPSDGVNAPLLACHTSGTTGAGLIFWETREAEIERWATWWRYREWHGIDFSSWCGYFGGRSVVSLGQTAPPYWRINRPGKQVMFSAYHLSSQTASLYCDAAQHHAVAWLHGYPSVLSLLAGYMIDQKLPAPPSVRVITTGAESLLPAQRKAIETAFDAPVFQHYGQAESVANISECEKHCLHVDEDFSLVELLPIEGAEGSYRIIGTNWSNPAFPLIRYDTGDVATYSSRSCGCGKPGRVIDSIDGRKEDFVTLPNCAKIGRLDHIFKDLVHVREAQVYQHDRKGILFRVVKGSGYDENHEERRLLAEARKRLGTALAIDIQYVDAIPRTKTGKLRFVISDLERKDGSVPE